MNRVLVIEDNEELAYGLQNNLEIDGYEVFVATDGLTGLHAAERQRPDLVILDLMLPSLDGFRLLRSIRSGGMRMPVLILTARDAEIVVPLSTLQRRVMNVDTIGGAKLLVRDPARVEETARALKALLRERHALAKGQPDNFTVITSTQVQRTVRKVERVLFVFLPLVSAVTLLVACVVAASLMISSVSARVGEIGLRQAVGARPRDIQLQFLLETAVTSLGGGVLGLLIGLGLAQWVAHRFTLGGVFSWPAIFLGLGAATLTGLLAGVAPARRAARLTPADALR